MIRRGREGLYQDARSWVRANTRLLIKVEEKVQKERIKNEKKKKNAHTYLASKM